MIFTELRKKHPRLIYQSYQIEENDRDLSICFQFLLEPDITFTPKIVLPKNAKSEKAALENFIFHLGLIEAVSYWKAACPQEFLIEAGKLSPDQVTWWRDFFLHGLGEFFYQNRIDFTSLDFLQISTKTNCNILPKEHFDLDGDLILVGGGRDSAVTLEILKNLKRRKQILLLNPTKAALEIINLAGYQSPLVVKRVIDPKLLELNRRGYLNGHTPFSAYLAFLGILIAALHGYQNAIASNERSSNEGNVVFHNLEVNHQYSKSFRFEKLFRDYCREYLSGDIHYFSLLRPLFELQISRLFAGYPKYHRSFRSCNLGRKSNSWCGACPKCVFVYLSLFPFLPYRKMIEIFGEDYYRKPEIQPLIFALAGLGPHKPFECVGTEEETKVAIALTLTRYRLLKQPPPPLLLSLEEKLKMKNMEDFLLLEKSVLEGWGREHFLSPEYLTLLKNEKK